MNDPISIRVGIGCANVRISAPRGNAGKLSSATYCPQCLGKDRPKRTTGPCVEHGTGTPIWDTLDQSPTLLLGC